jgi:hypothetical protein
MISQQHKDIHVKEEEIPSPHNQPPPEPTFLWRSCSTLLRIIGVVLVCAVYYVVGPLPNNVPDWVIIYLVLAGVVGAVLIRSWWSLLLVALVFSIWFFGSPFGDLSGSGETNVLIITAWLFTLLIIEISAAIGTFTGKWIEELLRH